MFMSPRSAVGSPAALDEEGDVVDEGGVADQGPAPAPEEVEERGDGEADGEGEAEEASRLLRSALDLGRQGQNAGILRCAQDDSFKIMELGCWLATAGAGRGS